MISFLISLLLLFIGYKTYGTFLDRKFQPDDRQTPAITKNDGVDYVPMKTWKVFLIQLLNIAGLGPIFGAITGALWGPVVFLWIVFGTIFAGAVHDYLSGMLSERNGGASIAEIVGKYLGNVAKQIMRVFSIILLMMVGVVFMVGPAELIAMLTPKTFDVKFWTIVILCYYCLSSFLPIDKLVSKIYPIFGISLLIMAFSIGGVTLVNDINGTAKMPELWDYFRNVHFDKTPIFPMMFVSVACGAISGFHATQSPMMARCITSEKEGKKVFYGAMCMESVIALIWASASSTFFYDPQTGGWLAQKLVNINGKDEIIRFIGNSASVYGMSMSLLGLVGGIFAILGVIACPVTSGDASFRSVRFALADLFKIDQKNILKRLILTLCILGTGYGISRFEYGKIWRYFSWSNQTLAMIVLWAGAVYLCNEKGKNIGWIASIPATFMSAVSMSYLLQAPECFALYPCISNIVGVLFAFSLLSLYFFKIYKKK